jgi:uncharacterized protein
LLDRLEPAVVSKHLAWSRTGGVYLNHLLPLPYTEETLAYVVRHVTRAQDMCQRRLLIENPSSYLRFTQASMTESEFLCELVRRTDCGLLGDVNNLYVSCQNLGGDPLTYLDALPARAVEEIHLAGYTENDADGQRVLIDDHGAPVAEAVWALYAHALRCFGPVATLIEWDTHIPPLAVVLREAQTATQYLCAREDACHADLA